MVRRKLYCFQNVAIPRKTLYRMKKRRETEESLQQMQQTEGEEISIANQCHNTGVTSANDVSLPSDSPNSVQCSETAENIETSSSDSERACRANNSERTVSFGEENNELLHAEDHVSWNEEREPSAPVCPCTTSTPEDVMLMCLSIGLRHNLPWLCHVDILKMINAMYGNYRIPDSKYNYFQFIDRSGVHFKYHIYCSKCENYFGDRDDLPDNLVCMCGNQIVTSSADFFLSVDLESQLKELLKDPDIAESMVTYRFTRTKKDENALEDIYDGFEYKKHVEEGILSSPLNFSFNFSTDGVPFGVSSAKTIWPIYITLNEIPPNQRKKHVLLAGLYVGHKDPNQNVFLQPFVQQANYLATEGFTWQYKGTAVHSKLVPMCAIVDSVARFQVLNMSGISAYYACTFCYQKAVHTTRGRRFPPSVEPCLCRTRESTERDMQKALRNRNDPDPLKRVVKGVKGPCALLAMIYFSLILGFVPDYMHCVLLGVIRLHTELIFESIRKKFWDVPEDIGMEHIKAVLDEKLIKICAPKSITRSVRSLTQMSKWKASEWRSWLIFYCVPCLKGFLRPKHLKHISMLSKAVNILLQRSVTIHSVKEAHSLLIGYVCKFNKYFGETNMVLNVHLLTHLAQGVINWGPLWTHNAFIYEGQNRHLLQLVHGPGEILKQMARKFLIYSNFPCLLSTSCSQNNTYSFCEQILKQSLKRFVECDNVLLLGKKEICQFSSEEQACMSHYVNLEDDIFEFKRMLYKGTRYSCDSYVLNKRHNDAFVAAKNRIAIIKKITVTNDNKVFIIVRDVLVCQDPVVTDTTFHVDHIKEVLHYGSLQCILPQDIQSQYVYMDLSDKQYVCSMPYGCRGD